MDRAVLPGDAKPLKVLPSKPGACRWKLVDAVFETGRASRTEGVASPAARASERVPAATKRPSTSGAKGSVGWRASGWYRWELRRWEFSNTSSGRAASMRRSGALALSGLRNFPCRCLTASCKTKAASSANSGPSRFTLFPTAMPKRITRPAACDRLGGCAGATGATGAGLCTFCCACACMCSTKDRLRSVGASGDEISPMSICAFRGVKREGVLTRFSARPRSLTSRTRCHPCNLGLAPAGALLRDCAGGSGGSMRRKESEARRSCICCK
mmetsp:Transcript_13636/g.30133  ORF Transcript_13636/g.30133 Transcript_13636/m.30133 type:complete len:271 (+) Transcript_13636:897-1709(+)